MKFAACVFSLVGLGWACHSDEDCNLNGVCNDAGACVCDPAWTGSDCGILDVVPNSATRIYSDDDDVSSWGGLPVWDDETQLYHLFASEFANGCSLGQWSPNSQVVRATSAELMGPYERQEVVLPPFHHNPTLIRAADGTWLIYAIGREVPAGSVKNCSGSLGGDPAPGNRESNITAWSSTSILGPWNRIGVVLAGDEVRGAWDADRTNPSAYADADGGVHLMYRGCGWSCSGGEYMGMSIAPRWNCSVDVPGGCRYERTSVEAPLWRDTTGEDPFLFKDRRGHWHAMLHNLGRNGGFGCNNKTWHGCDVGGHAFSRDGISWTLSETIPYTTNVTWINGKREILNRRERPQFVMADDCVTPLSLVTGVQKGDVPASCSQGGTVASKECRSFTMAVSLRSSEALMV
eukprot:TRINITY_DN45067_c0_g1_i1.p1 TRINITY_DN45067_c0_g1~~TRINITY_DN45067_c0_g1_i1.p1  ORF type:complete len:421 (-),score=51.22 TRINITY_DN45067_c0_g1_i1:198-1412(-)